MTLDVRGSLKNTRVSQRPLVVIDELISNAIDSYLIRINADSNINGLSVKLQFEFFRKDLEGDDFDVKLSCTDNGSGLGDAQTKAFVTKDTSYKDDLAIDGIGKCKGSGRIQYLHFFSKIRIRSVFSAGGVLYRRNLSFDDGMKEIDQNSFTTHQVENEDIETTIVLEGLKEDVFQKHFRNKDVSKEFSAFNVRNYVFFTMLQRLVNLKEKLGDFKFSFKSILDGIEIEYEITAADLPEAYLRVDAVVEYQQDDPKLKVSSEEFFVTHYKLPESEFNLTSNIVSLCAKSAPVSNITKLYLKMGKIENNPIDEHFHIILIESDFFDRNVNEERDGFNNIPDAIKDDDMFGSTTISFEKIYEILDPIINKMLTPPEWTKEEVIEKVSEQYGISPSMIADTKTRIHFGHDEHYVAERVLQTYQQRVIEDTAEIFKMKSEIELSEPDSDDFRDKVNELSWKYTASLKSIDMANLSQLIVRRAAIVEILSMAIDKKLNSQKPNAKKRRNDEEIIHSIFFPMKKDSDDVTDHDIWLLGEDYGYFDYIASDKPLSQITWDDGTLLFEQDIDEEIEKIFDKTNSDNLKKRPDIALFNHEGSAVIIEFKAPGVDMSNHTGDLMEYAQLLAAKSKGRLKKFYGYLIGDELNELRIRGYTQFPTGKGWFSTDDIIQPTTKASLGELYSEILFYEDVVIRANGRIKTYKDRLNLDF